MSWRCPSCNAENKDSLVRCTCGYEIGDEEKANVYSFRNSPQTLPESIEAKSDNRLISLAISTLIGGIVLLGIGIYIEPGISSNSQEVVNLHKIHIKQTLYYFSGVCFIISALTYGFNILLKAKK